MSLAGNWRALSQLKSTPIDTRCFDVVQRSRVNAIEAIRSGLPGVRPRPWRDEAASLGKPFRLQAAIHCFNEAPHAWIDPLEPQITKGFVYFLTTGPQDRQRARCLSFVKAALACSPRTVKIEDTWHPLSFCAEAEENRIDMLVELTDGKTRFGAAIEAKFGHRLTPGQLEKAESHVLDQAGRAWDTARSAFLVIAPLVGRIDTKQLKSRPYWRPTSWWAFLVALDHQIDGLQDCADYRRFRRSVWHKAY